MIIINFTQEMKQVIIDTYPLYGINEVLKVLNIEDKYKPLVFNVVNGLKLRRIGKYFTEDEIQYLKNNYNTLTVKEIATHLGKSKESICTKASRLNLHNDKYYWSKKDVEYLKNNYKNVSYKEMSKDLGKSVHAIQTKIFKLGIVVDDTWYEDEIEKMKELYPYYTNKKLSESFFINRTAESINQMARKLNLKKSDSKRNKFFNKEDMINGLKLAYEKLQRTPYESELVEMGLPSGKTFDRYFGTYKQACVTANIPPNSAIFGKSVGCTSINGIPCSSKSEKIVCDYLENNNITYLKEERYDDYIKDDRCGGKRFDWVVGKYFIEFFGMPEKEYYKNKMNEKINICKDNNIILISLFKNDLKDLDKKLHVLLQ